MNKTHSAIILSAVESGAHKSREIAQRTGIALESVQARLTELRRAGVLQSYAMRTDGRWGRPPKFYRIANKARAAGTTG